MAQAGKGCDLFSKRQMQQLVLPDTQKTLRRGQALAAPEVRDETETASIMEMVHAAAAAH